MPATWAASCLALLRSASLVLLAGAFFFILFRTGANLRFAGKRLTVPQMLASTLVILYTMYAANGGRAVFVVILLMIFLFGVLRLTIRPLLAQAGATLVGYAGVIVLLWAWRPQVLNLTLELLQWCALAITLPWFGVREFYARDAPAAASAAGGVRLDRRANWPVCRAQGGRRKNPPAGIS